MTASVYDIFMTCGIRISGVVVSYLNKITYIGKLYCAVKNKVYCETMCVLVSCWLNLGPLS